MGKEAVGDDYGGVPALPESFFIGRDGKIVDKIIGLKGRARSRTRSRRRSTREAGEITSSDGPTALQAQK